MIGLEGRFNQIYFFFETNLSNLGSVILKSQFFLFNTKKRNHAIKKKYENQIITLVLQQNLFFFQSKSHRIESRLMSNSKFSTVQRTPSESRIIEKKNVQKRLQNLSLKQLQRIHTNLINQNLRLKDEVQNFSQKVKKLIQSKKFDVQTKPNPLIQNQILKIKKQLESKYLIMKDLKQQIKIQHSKISLQQVSTNYKEKINEIRAIEVQIQQLTKQKEKLTSSIRDNEIDYQEYLPGKDLTVQIQLLKEDNKNLKKKIYDISFKIKDNQKTAKQALNKIYTLKKQTDTFQNNKIKRIRSFSVMNKFESTAQNFQSSELKALRKSLKKQITLLKQQKIDLESSLTTEKTAKQLAKSKKQEEVSQLLEYHKKLIKKRVRELTELNFLKNKEAELNLQKQLELQKSKIPLLQKGIQTENFIKKEYRKDWIGRSEGLEFNDTQILEFKQFCFIKLLSVYRTNDRIVFIRFGYENPNSKYKYETKLPFDKDNLKRMDNKRVVSKNNGHLINLTLSITKEVITRVESFWSDGDSSVQGWQTEESSKYSFDINQKQRPLAFYGTVSLNSKGSYALQSLGCEILQNEQ